MSIGNKYDSAFSDTDYGMSKFEYVATALKYVWRAGKKNEMVECLSKAVWYLQTAIKELEK